MSAQAKVDHLRIAKNDLRICACQLKDTIKDVSLQASGFEEKRNALIEKCDEILAWLDSNPNPQLHEFDDKQSQIKRSFHELLEVIYHHYEYISNHSFIRSN